MARDGVAWRARHIIYHARSAVAEAALPKCATHASYLGASRGNRIQVLHALESGVRTSWHRLVKMALSRATGRYMPTPCRAGIAMYANLGEGNEALDGSIPQSKA